ncbi:MAG: hypothetical protein K9K88_02760 [Desulfobacterales bacterium]|nr:hypothetical protein [Desulfobacterales bacterium]
MIKLANAGAASGGACLEMLADNPNKPLLSSAQQEKPATAALSPRIDKSRIGKNLAQ